MGKNRNKKIKEAVALKYSPYENNAPQVIAVGKGEAAEKIIEKAEESSIPIYNDPELAHTLSALNLGDEIPHELYDVVAEILAFLNKLDEKYTREV